MPIKRNNRDFGRYYMQERGLSEASNEVLHSNTGTHAASMPVAVNEAQWMFSDLSGHEQFDELWTAWLACH